MSDDDIRLSKFLSYVLRHRPGEWGVVLDRAGWADVDEVLDAFAKRADAVVLDDLRRVVLGNDKQRFELDASETKIRARQGHSLEVELGYEVVTPPELLYHGTAQRFVAAILEQGLHKGQRHHVHLSESEELALAVGARRGRAQVLVVEAVAMARSGHVFHRTANGVWLTEHVPPEFLRLRQ